MSKNSPVAQVKSEKGKGKSMSRTTGFAFLLFTFAFLTGCGVRFDMQDQPRYKAYKKSDFFKDGRASRDLPEGTIPRGLLKENKAFYTGKIDNPNPNVQVETSTNAAGNTIVATRCRSNLPENACGRSE